MEEKFVAVWLENREKARKLGARLRPIAREEAMKQAHRMLSGNRTSDGFAALADLQRLDLSLEALVVSRQFTQLFSDEEANSALEQLLAAGYSFKK